MLSRKSNVVIASVVALLSILSVIYLSCTKPELSPFSCSGVVCENGGYCDSSHCKCPKGYEGVNCGIASAKRYKGSWKIHQEIIGSDTTHLIGNDTTYYVNIVASATPTTFFINNFAGDPSYNDVVCIIDSINTRTFRFDTLSTFHMIFDHYKMLYGYGAISSNDSEISAHVAVRHLNSTINWQNDTLALTLKLQSNP